MRYVVAVMLLLNATFALSNDKLDEPEAVINAQIAAFQSDDLDTAFSFASPTIKRIFGSAERFGQMVKRSYPMVWRPTAVRFGALVMLNGRSLQTVYFTDQAGSVFEAQYDMLEADSGWHINGVAIRRAGLGA